MNILPDSIKKIARNSFSTVIVRGSFGLTRIIILMLIAKVYGPYAFGLFTLALTFMEITKVAADIGVDVVSIRRYGSEKKNPHALLESIIGFKIISSSIGIVLALLVFAWMYHNLEGWFLLLAASASVVTSLMINAFVSYYQTQLSMEKLIKAHLWGIGFYFILSMIAITAGFPLIVLMLIIPVTEAFTLFKLIRQYTSAQRIKVKYDLSFMRSLISESIFVGISGIIVIIYLRMDNVMISRLLDISSIGRYAFAYRLTEPFSLVFTSFGISLYASLSCLPKDTLTMKRIELAKSTLIPMLVLAAAAILLFIFVIRPILPWFSPEYTASGNVLLILGFVLIFKAVSSQTISILNSMGKFRIISVISGMNLVVSIALSLLLIPYYGIQGAALAVVSTEFMGTIFQSATIYYFHRQDRILQTQ